MSISMATNSTLPSLALPSLALPPLTLPSLGLSLAGGHAPASAYATILAATLILVLASCSQLRSSSRSTIPLLNPKGRFEFSDTRIKADFVTQATQFVLAWFKANPDKATRVLGDVGEVIVLPYTVCNEIRYDKRLSFRQRIFNDFHGHLPGFNGFHAIFGGKPIVQAVVTKDLTKRLSKVIEPLSDETSLAVQEYLTDSKEWHSIQVRDTILTLVARISSRVFLGDELCRNESWLRITRDYTVTIMRAADSLRLWPSALQPLVHWFLGDTRNLRRLIRDARTIVNRLLDKRRALKADLEAQGKKAPEYNDAIEWFERNANGAPYDSTAVQLSLSFTAIHTTTDLVCQVLTDLAQNQWILKPLRDEIVSVLGEKGWQKTSLYDMKLLDSVIKESQRMKPVAIVSMLRLALEDITLSDGTFIPKGTNTAMSSDRMWDPAVHTDPEKWDGYRFLRMREQPGGEHLAQLVTTSPDHNAFGHGQYACPGRFFAANEIKLALIFIIMRYDFKLPDGAKAPETMTWALQLMGDPDLKFDVRRRDEEVVL